MRTLFGLVALVGGTVLVAMSLYAFIDPKDAGLSNDSNPYATISQYFVLGYLVIGVVLLWVGAGVVFSRFKR